MNPAFGVGVSYLLGDMAEPMFYGSGVFGRLCLKKR
jgi:hypothetical protein